MSMLCDRSVLSNVAARFHFCTRDIAKISFAARAIEHVWLRSRSICHRSTSAAERSGSVAGPPATPPTHAETECRPGQLHPVVRRVIQHVPVDRTTPNSQHAGPVSCILSEEHACLPSDRPTSLPALGKPGGACLRLAK